MSNQIHLVSHIPQSGETLCVIAPLCLFRLFSHSVMRWNHARSTRKNLSCECCIPIIAYEEVLKLRAFVLFLKAASEQHECGWCLLSTGKTDTQSLPHQDLSMKHGICYRPLPVMEKTRVCETDLHEACTPDYQWITRICLRKGISFSKAPLLTKRSLHVLSPTEGVERLTE